MNKRLKRPLLKYEIEEAQANSLSANQAAKYLGVNIVTYKKYAQLYGIYENLLNKKGVGIDKGYGHSNTQSIKLKDVFANKHPDYPLQRLRWRMVNRGLIEDRCMMCGFGEERITDQKKPILMTFKETQGDYTLTNLIMLCYNCCFLTRNAPTIVNKRYIRSSLDKEGPSTASGWKDPSNLPTNMTAEPVDDLSDEEIQKLREEIDRELGR